MTAERTGDDAATGASFGKPDEAVAEEPRNEGEPVRRADAESGASGTVDSREQLELSPKTPEELQSRIDQLEGEIEHLQDQLLRRQAELVNYRRRVERERAEADQVSRAAVVREFLPSIDDFERALASDGEDVETYRQGMEIILKGIESVLAGLGVVRIDPAGEEFDPELHEAIARHPTDEIPDGHVFDVYQPGYRLGDRLIRPAKVVVAASPDGGADASPNDDARGDE